MNDPAALENDSKADWISLPNGLNPAFVFGLAVLLGAGLRIAIVLKADFPHNDGGLFNSVTQELIQSGFHLPVTIPYNSGQIPFVYPPLGFYLAGALTAMGFSLIQLQRLLPLIFCILTIPAFALLTRTFTHRSDLAALSTLAFALLPYSTDRLLMGGGLTRAPGFFFSLLALNWIYLSFENGKHLYISLAALFSTLTLLTHPVYTTFVVFSALVFYLFLPKKRRNLISGMLVAGGVLLLSAIWWLQILTTHSIDPILGALASRNALPLIVRLSQLLFFDLSGEYFLELIGVFSLFGLIFTLLDRHYLLPAWLIAIFIFERTAPVSLAVVPLAMLAGIGGARMIEAGSKLWKTGIRSRFVMIAFSVLVYYSLISSYIRFDAAVLTPDNRESLTWIAENSSAGSIFLVLSGYPWWDDPVTEWFPTLTDRVSVTTVQGYEWTTPDQFSHQAQIFTEAGLCLQSIEVSCLDEWAGRNRVAFDYIFIPQIKPPKGSLPVGNSALVQALRGSERYTLINEDSGGLVFQLH